MDPDRLKCFLTVAECLSFTKAGHRLNLSQSAISYQVAALEDSLGIKVFKRDTHQVMLTKAGAYICRELQKLTADYAEIVNKGRNFESGILGNITLGYLGGIEKKIIPPFLKRFSQDHPEISILFKLHTVPSMIRALDCGGIDVGFTVSLGFEVPPEFESTVLFSDFPYVLMRPDHSLAGRTSLVVEDLDGIPMIALSKELGVHTFDWMGSLFLRHGTRLNIVKRAEDISSLMMLVESGQGVAFLTRHMAKLYPGFRVHCVDMVSDDARVDSLILWKKSCENPLLPVFLKNLGIFINK